MDARAYTWIWLLLLILNIIKLTSSSSLKYDYDYDTKKETGDFKRDIPTEGFDTLIGTTSIDKMYTYEPGITKRHEIYEQFETNAMTSMGPIESSAPYELADLSEKYDSLAITEFMDSNKTVIPLTSTDNYESTATHGITKSNSTEIFTTVPSTEEYRALSDMTINNTTIPVTDLPKDNKTYNYIETVESEIPVIQRLSRTEGNETINPNKELAVVGIPAPDPSNVTDITKTKVHKDIIMVLRQSNNDKYVWLKENVHSLVETSMLKRETEEYVVQLNRRYEDLPTVEADNLIWRKYARAVAESFVLDFCRNNPNYIAKEKWTTPEIEVEEYNTIYNMTLLHLQQKKGQTAIHIATAVQRVADIYRAILDTPIGIVQSKCQHGMQHWMCFAEYVVHLEEIAETCEYIWYHAQVHLTMLQYLRSVKGVHYPANDIVDELDLRLSELEPNNDVDYLFDFIIRTLDGFRKKIMDSLLTQVRIYNFIRELQREDKLKCLNIDQML